MIGALKKLFGKPASPPPADATVTEVPSHSRPPATPLAPAVPAAPAPLPATIPTVMGGMIALPLDEILSHLPYTMAPMVLSRPGGMFSFPLSEAMRQMPTGAVRITFAQLRQGSPSGTFAADAMHDDSLIDLPLHLILTAIGPGALERRADQKRTEVPDEVTGVFLRTHGHLHPGTKVSVARAVALTVPPPVAPKPAPIPVPAPPPVPPPIAPKTVSPIPFPATPKQTIYLVPGPAAPKPAAPAPMPFAAPPPIPFAAPAPAPTGDNIVTSLEALSGAWPDPVREEIQKLALGSVAVSIPASRLEAGMKAGRVVFAWSEVAGWLSGTVPPSPHGETQVELPLKVVAPLFLAKDRPSAPRKVVTADDALPEVFTGLKRSLPTSPMSAPAAPVTPAAPVVIPVPAAVSVLGEIFGQPSKMEWTPEEVARQVSTMLGVSGALLAASDGFLVAGGLPPPLKAETMAAFLPQIFRRVGVCAEEAQLGSLRALRLWAGQAPCAIFKAGSFFLVVVGRQGQALPEAALERIAGELAQKKP